jgi:hypothetical protein
MNSWWRRVAGKSILQRGMEETPEKGKELSHSAHANGMNSDGLMFHYSFILPTVT